MSPRVIGGQLHFAPHLPLILRAIYASKHRNKGDKRTGVDAAKVYATKRSPLLSNRASNLKKLRRAFRIGHALRPLRYDNSGARSMG